MQRYWIVFSNGSGQSGKYPSLKEAKDAAMRLSKKHPDEVFTVLESLFEIKSKVASIITDHKYQEG